MAEILNNAKTIFQKGKQEIKKVLNPKVLGVMVGSAVGLITGFNSSNLGFSKLESKTGQINHPEQTQKIRQVDDSQVANPFEQKGTNLNNLYTKASQNPNVQASLGPLFMTWLRDSGVQAFKVELIADEMAGALKTEGLNSIDDISTMDKQKSIIVVQKLTQVLNNNGVGKMAKYVSLLNDPNFGQQAIKIPNSLDLQKANKKDLATGFNTSSFTNNAIGAPVNNLRPVTYSRLVNPTWNYSFPDQKTQVRQLNSFFIFSIGFPTIVLLLISRRNIFPNLEQKTTILAGNTLTTISDKNLKITESDNNEEGAFLDELQPAEIKFKKFY